MSKPRKKMTGHKNSCNGKQCFAEEDKALAACKRGRYNYMGVYKCKKCKLFHYGHPGPKQLPKMGC